MPALRRRFLILFTLCYAFLGAGPSLWALGLQEAASAPVCEALGCHCHMGPGAQCHCRFMAAMMKRHSHGGCEMRQSPLAPQESASGAHSLPSLQPHLGVQSGLAWHLNERFQPYTAASRGVSFHPEPPTPIPD
jgi:hypothetical protein